MKKVFKSILQTAMLVVVVIVLGTCGSVSKVVNEPSISFESVRMTGLNFSKIDMIARIKVQNDNSFSIPFPEINWKLFVIDNSFINGVIKNNTKIAANAGTVVELPFSINYEGLYQAISGLLNSDEAPFRLDLSALFNIPVLGAKTFNTSFSGSIPMLKAPALSFSGVKFNSLSINKVEFVLTWLVDNKNVFAVNLDKMDYNFTVNNTSWSQGTAPRSSLPARRTTQVPITVNISSLSMIQEIVALAALGRSANFVCSGEAALSPVLNQSFPGLENVAALRLPFTYSGSTNLRP
ncbi:MAG: LEA type 2 family protein [Treponema sp.]|nr:LEA type 2 family protein [Treponema sp.]